MDEPPGRFLRFFQELKRRNVYRVAVAYAVVSFVTLQAAQLVFPATTLEGVYDVLVLLAFVGFPIALVLAWAFEMTPEGVRRTPEAEPSAVGEGAPGAEDGAAPPGAGEGPGAPPFPGSDGRESRFALKALVALGLLAAAVAGGWYLMGGGGVSPTITEQTVAVLPFQVSGSGTETWREGMVTVLSTGLDGAAGLRAIADRSVLSAWDRAGEAAGPGGDRSLEVARQVGAEYAVVGSAVKLGSEIRFSVTVHRTSSGEQLGRAEVRGPPDSVTRLADELTRRLLGVLLEESGEGLPSVDLGALTTRSLPALKSFLRGEEHFRRGEFEAAISEYRRAIERDSLFALAHWRLGRAYGWQLELPGASERSRRHRARAHELSHRLPERERQLVRADYLLRGRRPHAAADTLRQLTRAYPEDADAWYLLGEAPIHYGVPPGWPAADRAFGRAVALDSGFAPYHTHRVDLAFSVHRDSALAAVRIAAHPALDGTEPWLRVVNGLVFGDSARRAAAVARLDTLPLATLRRAGSIWTLPPGESWVLEMLIREQLDREALPDPAATAEALVLTELYNRGQVRQALRSLERPELDPSQRACLAADARSVGLPVPDSLAPGELDPAGLEGEPSLARAFCIGLYAATRGRTEVAERALAYLRERAETEGDTAAGPGAAGRSPDPDDFAAILSGYRAWRAGRLERALGHLERVPVASLRHPQSVWIGDIHRALGNLSRAEEWYLGFWHWGLAHERLGQLYEEMGKPEKAAAAYRRFVEAWEDADGELQDRVESARVRIRELSATGSESSG